jgi:hypothetical protein
LLNQRYAFAPTGSGQPDRVQLSDIAALPVRLGAAVRSRRLFHPAGVLAAGDLERIAAPGEGLPLASGHVVSRVSKGVGLPGSVPDIAGVAWRMPPQSAIAPPWDVLLASTFRSRILLAPVGRWSDASFSSLMPFRFDGGVWWLRARLATRIDMAGLSLDTIRSRIGLSGIDIDIEQAAGTGEFLPLARLALRTLAPNMGDVAFDPVLHLHPDVTLLPEWLTGFRRAAYRRSREGRDAE